MHDEDGWFDADAAAHYDDPTDDHFADAVIGRTVDVLAELAGDGRALELAIGTGRIGLPLAARGVPVDGIELSRRDARRAPGQAGWRHDPGHDRRHGQRRRACRTRVVSSRISRVQHDHEPDHPGGPGRMLPQRGAAPRARRRASSSRSACRPCASSRPGRASSCSTMARPTAASTSTTPATQGLVSHHLELRRRAMGGVVGAVPLRLARRARPDGRAGGAAPRRIVGRAGAASRSPTKASSTSRSGSVPWSRRRHESTRDAAGLHRADAGDARRGAVRRSGLAVRDQVGWLPRGNRHRRRRGAALDPRPAGCGALLRRVPGADDLDRGTTGGRRRRGHRAR